jgi:hypothetical protein
MVLCFVGTIAFDLWRYPDDGWVAVLLGFTMMMTWPFTMGLIVAVGHRLRRGFMLLIDKWAEALDL